MSKKCAGGSSLNFFPRRRRMKDEERRTEEKKLWATILVGIITIMIFVFVRGGKF